MFVADGHRNCLLLIVFIVAKEMLVLWAEISIERRELSVQYDLSFEFYIKL